MSQQQGPGALLAKRHHEEGERAGSVVGIGCIIIPFILLMLLLLHYFIVVSDDSAVRWLHDNDAVWDPPTPGECALVKAECVAEGPFISKAEWHDTNLLQQLMIAVLSMFFNIFVLLFHWTNPPHPKFEMRWPRWISIRLHLVSGTCEIMAGFLIWFWRAVSEISFHA